MLNIILNLFIFAYGLAPYYWYIPMDRAPSYLFFSSQKAKILVGRVFTASFGSRVCCAPYYWQIARKSRKREGWGVAGNLVVITSKASKPSQAKPNFKYL
jgi:hypothetical protein